MSELSFVTLCDHREHTSTQCAPVIVPEGTVGCGNTQSRLTTLTLQATGLTNTRAVPCLETPGHLDALAGTDLEIPDFDQKACKSTLLKSKAPLVQEWAAERRT